MPKTFVLRETTKKRKKPLWFRAMTRLGPMTTECIDEAMEFGSREDAILHPVHRFTLTSFDVEEKPDA